MKVVYVCAVAAALSACAASSPNESNASRRVAERVGLASPVPDPASFVQESRPTEFVSIPVGTAAPPRKRSLKTPQERLAAEQALQGAAQSNTARAVDAQRAGSTPAPQAAPKPAPIKLD
jgi:hypothetical protein